MKMKILSKIIFLLLVVSGAVLILLPTYNKVKLKEEVQMAVTVIEETPPQVLKENDEKVQP